MFPIAKHFGPATAIRILVTTLRVFAVAFHAEMVLLTLERNWVRFMSYSISLYEES